MRAIILSALLLVSCSQASADNIRGACNPQLSWNIGGCIVRSPGMYEGGDTIYFKDFKDGLFTSGDGLGGVDNILRLKDDSITPYEVESQGQYSWDNPHTYFEVLGPSGLPSAGFTKVWAKAGAGLCTTDSFGVERCTQAGAGGGANTLWQDLDFTTAGKTVSSAVIIGEAWVTATSIIVCSPTMMATSSRAEGAEDAVIEGMTVAVHTRVNGVGFTLTGGPANGRAYGLYRFHCIGV